MDLRRMLSVILSEPQTSHFSSFTGRVDGLDDLWRDRYFHKTYGVKFGKIFQDPDGGGERLTVESLHEYIQKCPKVLWWSQHFVMCLQDFLIEKINTSDCQDPALVAAVINFNAAYKKRSLSRVRRFVDFELQPTPRRVSNVLEGVNFQNLAIDRVVCDRKLPLLKLLIRYGAVPSQAMEGFDSSVADMLWEFLKSVSKPYRGVEFYYPTEETLILLSMNAKYLPPKRCHAEKYARYLRSQTIAMVISALNDALNDNDWNPGVEAVAVKCLRYYFEATPEPFVIVREMEELILGPDDLQHVVDISLMKEKFNRFTTLFPGWNVLEPRSLKHLSRCAARSYLCRQGMLPDVISKLTLPNVLKDYLLIKNVVDESD